MSHFGSMRVVTESPFSLIFLPVILVIAYCLWLVSLYLTSPLRRFPGPILAGLTNWWRLYHVWRGKSHIRVRDLHKKFGPVVRIRPNVLDLDYPELTKTIYNIKGDWEKTEFYHGSSVLGPNRKVIYNLFSQTDNDLHAREKRPISKSYSMNGVLPLEPHIDSTIEKLCNQLHKRFIDPSSTDIICDLGDWLLFYTWDVIGEVTFSQPVGYLDAGYDFDRTLWSAEKAIDYFCVVGQIPILDYYFDKNPVYRVGPPGFGTVVDISVKHLIQRATGKKVNDSDKADFLDKFLEAKQAYPDVVNDAQVISYLMINMIAGADTTAITIRSIVYYCIREPRVWKQLQKLIPPGESVVPYKDARALTYLEACVREAMRMHPPVAMLLERYVPSQGLALPDGKSVPPGAVVGLNPYIIARNTKVYGPDVDTFRPERWFQDKAESAEAFATRLSDMHSAELTFGAGSRICIGKHLGLLETYKVVATLFSCFEIELAHPEKEWKVVNSWFIRQEGLEVRLSRRQN